MDSTQKIPLSILRRINGLNNAIAYASGRQAATTIDAPDIQRHRIMIDSNPFVTSTEPSTIKLATIFRVALWSIRSYCFFH